MARQQMSGQVHVEVDAPAQEDLTLTLADLRQHYENLVNKYRKEWESWFTTKVPHHLMFYYCFIYHYLFLLFVAVGESETRSSGTN